MKNILILGAGTAGTMMAARLVRALPDGWQVTLIDRDDAHVYQPGLLFVPFGQSSPREIVRPRRAVAPAGVRLVLDGLDRVDPEARRVVLGSGEVLSYDLLILATGSRVLPEALEGLSGPGWRQSAFDFYTLEGATALAAALDRFERGRIVLNVAEMPIKCPVAPIEFLLLAEAFFTERGRRGAVEITYATPLEGAFTKPRAAAAFGDMLGKRGIHVESDFVASAVDGERRTLQAYDGRSLDYDLLVSIPPHGGAKVVLDSGLGDASGWFPTDKHTLQARDWPDIFALGDATDLPASKAGSVAHFQSEVLTHNVLRHIEGLPPLPAFDGHANCFIETGYGQAMLIDFNYETEPLPGRFPLPGVGPFTLLEESRTNHYGKLAFRWLYWNVLLRGADLPLDHRMLLAGKWS